MEPDQWFLIGRYSSSVLSVLQLLEPRPGTSYWAPRTSSLDG